ncbi:MAG TPA: carbohydrate kinase family protein [Candidatus Limiplasma sp.]|nr:carbohydrate kinase family protein [Candidatus Limiplasma sp.]
MAVGICPKAIVAGHICVDITPAIAPLGHESLSQLMQPGRLIHVGAADVHTGGCVANTGLALQKLGVPTRMVARVGRDAFADLLRGLLAADGADAALVDDPDRSTSYSVVIAPPGIDRIFLHNPGANKGFSETDVPDETLFGATLFHFGYPPMMTALCAHEGAELLALLARVKQRGLITSMDMAAIDPASEAAKINWPALLTRLLPSVDFFLPSAEEICFMLDRKRYAEWLTRADGRDVTEILDIQKDIAPLANQLLAMGCKVAVIKCGARGMYYASAASDMPKAEELSLSAAQWSGLSGFQPSFTPRRVLSATGAGDTSIAAFLASALEGCGLAHCVRRAAATGACCVEAYDALSGLEPLATLDRRIADGWR